MAIVIPAEIQGPPGGSESALAGMQIQPGTIGAAIEDTHCAYATRLRCLYSRAVAQLSAYTTFVPVAGGIVAHTSEADSADLLVAALTTGATCEVRVTVGASSVTLAGAGLLTGTITAPGADVDVDITVEMRTTSGTSIVTLLGVAVYEAALVALP